MRQINFNRINIFQIFSGIITIIIIGRLFQLQVIQHEYYTKLADASQYGELEIQAQRGEILITDHHSNEEFPLATNITLNLVFVDPTLVKDPFFITKQIGPLIFDLEQAKIKDQERIKEIQKTIALETAPEELEKLIKPLNDKELLEKFEKDLEEKITAQQRTEILLITELEDQQKTKIQKLNINGIEIIDKKLYAYPPQIIDRNSIASTLGPIIDIPSKKLEQILKGENRYVILKKKLHPDTTDQIEAIIKEDKKLKKDDRTLTGLGMKEEYFRYYPEQELAANIVGYVDHQGTGQYGIESHFDTELTGIAGRLQSKKDSIGKFITVGDSEIEASIDGDDIILTIDRSIQTKVDDILAKAVKKYNADSGQVLIMDPKTGEIIAMSHYPSFNPNTFGEVFQKTEIKLNEQQQENLYPTKTEGVYDFYINEITLDKYPVFEEIDENGIKHFYRYDNFRGPEVYHNKIASWPYEPGSVFKPVAMAIAIDDKDITPNTTFNDEGPIGVDWNVYTEEYDFEIKNSENKYYGLVNMSTVIGKSLNTGMTFIAKKMGSALFYSYMEKFGFMERTGLELDGEAIGQIENYESWTESELATHSFGQGITVTMLQMLNSYNTIANGGVLMQAHLIKEIRHDDGTVDTTETKEIRRVISEQTSNEMTAILLASTEEGVAKNAQVDNHYVAGKTGTSQTYKNGRALSGTGTTITSFAGYGPISDPKFTILVKLDHPRTSEWGSSTAAPVFKEIATYLFNYYNIPPDKEI